MTWREESELTLSRVGLGPLTETSALNLFADALSHAITDGTGSKAHAIHDARGNLLYPAYFMTHLRVPDGFDGYEPWSTVNVEIELSSFGGMMLESTAQLSQPGAAPGLTLFAGSVFVVEETRRTTVRPAIPAAGQINTLNKLSKKPDAAVQFDAVRADGLATPSPAESLEGLRYPLIRGRDIDRGHAMMFSSYAVVLDWAREQVTAIPAAELMAREVYYFADAYEGDTLRVDVSVARDAVDGERTVVYAVYSELMDRLLIRSRSLERAS